QMVWSTLPDGFHDYYNKRWYDFIGVPDGSTDGEAWTGMFHPDDQEQALAKWRHSLATGDPYEVEYRLRHHSGEYRWTIGRAMPIRDAEGRIIRWLGTCTDIDAAKRQTEHMEVLSRELSHRIKNIFAVIGGLIGLSARTHPEAADFAGDLRERIAALGRAHEFARPHSDESRPYVGDSTLLGMLSELMRPYPAFDDGRVPITGDDVVIDDRGATPLALTFHELVTNASKYGGLSTPKGSVEILSRHADDNIVLTWRERGGPSVPEIRSQPGFGTRLVEMSVTKQLGGTIARDWSPEGLTVTIEVQADRLAR
ncbi:MAG: PAS domain-containing protein, partial [Sphingomicrobium sp.]